MKVLLIGFSSPSATALMLLLNQQYPEHSVIEIERCFTNDLRLCLPNLPEAHRDATVMIISLEGVGMMQFMPQHIKALQKFIGARAALMTTKGSGEVWRQAAILPSDFGQFLTSPYTKADMEQALVRLFEVAPQLTERRHEFKYQEMAGDALEEYVTINMNAAPKEVNGSFLHRVIERHFDIKQRPLLHELVDLALDDRALKLTVGSQAVYINRKKNVALVSNIERLMDYCAIVNNFEALSQVIQIEAVSEHEVENALNMSAKNGYKTYALNAFLWRVCARMLPARIEVPDHNLRFKMRAMPNFAQMGETPEYVRALTALCLVAPRCMGELVEHLAGAVDKAVANRVFLLAILSGMADLEVLEQSFSEMMLASESEQTINQGVQKAQKTGFLRRLLEKLKF